MTTVEDIKKQVSDANTAAAVAALEAQVNKTRASYANMNRDAKAAAKEGAGMIEGRMQRAGMERPVTDTAGLMLKSAAGNAIASNREQQRLGEIQSANNIRFVAGAGQENADKLRKQQAQQKAETLAQYGDFSGYGELGYAPEQIQGMKAAYDAEKNKPEDYKGLGSYAETLLDLYATNAGFDVESGLRQALENGLITERDYQAALIAAKGIVPGSKAKKKKSTGTNPADDPMTAAEEAFSRIEGMRGDKYIVRTMDDWKALQSAYGDKMVDYFVYEPQRAAELVYVPGYGEITWEEAYALEQQGAVDVTEDKDGNTVFYQLRPGRVSTRMQR
jgi:hypothetical protein